MARLAKFKWAAPTLVTAALVATAWAIGCGNAGNDAAMCIGEGCACNSEGAAAECATTIAVGDDSITCRSGTRTCSGGHWGACSEGDKISITSKPALGAKSTGSSACVDNPCDPDCKRFDDDPSDLDGGGVALADGGGITLGDADITGFDSGCTGLTCKIDPCGGDYTKTQVTGRVYDPAGKNPVYNVLVYVPNAKIDPITDGVSCDTCKPASGKPIVSALTDYTGQFTLKGVPNGTNIPIVIQSGNWRRQLTISTVNKCVSTDTSTMTGSDGLPLVRFPKNRSEGDIPRIAFVSGSADPFQCVLKKMGIDVSTASSEVGVPYVGGKLNPQRIHYYQGTSSAGQNLDSTLGGGAPSASGLYDTAAHLNQYDAIILSCEGGEYNKGTSTVNQRLVDYVSAGGRVFATHFSYAYLQFAPTASNWPKVVKAWNHAAYPASPMTTFINQTFAKGDSFAKWLNFVGASPTTGQLAISEGRHDYDYVDTANATPWMYSNSDGSLPGGSAGLPAGAGCFTDSVCASGSCTSIKTTPIANGDFEAGLTGWTIAGPSASVSTSAHGGTKALQLGTNAPTAAGYATTATASFTAPGGTSKLSFWYLNVCNDSVTYDWATATLKDNTTGAAAATILPKTCTNSGTWQQITTNLVAGHNYTVVFTNRDDDWPDGKPARLVFDPSWTLFDDVAVISSGNCASGTACKVASDCGSGTGVACWNGTCVPAHGQEPLMTFNVPVGVAPDKQCGRVVYSDFHVSASALGGSATTFPNGCNGGDLSAQEKALEFMLFDLTSCLSPDYVPPPPPPTFTKTTVTRDYAATCPVGSRPVWHFFDWKTITPSDSSISFTVQTGDTTAAVNAMTALPLATVTGPPITTWTGVDVATVLGAAKPPVASGNLLRVNMTLTPSSDASSAPTLVDWRQSYSCKAEE